MRWILARGRETDMIDLPIARTSLAARHCLRRMPVWAVAGALLTASSSLWGQTVEWTLRAEAGTPNPPSRNGAGMAHDSTRGVTVLFGGGISSKPFELGDTWEWDGTSWTRRDAPGPTARSAPAMAYDSFRRQVVLFGGFDAFDNGETWLWNGGNWAYRSVGGPSARSGHEMVFDSTRGVVVLFGGSANFTNSPETWEWNGATWSLRATQGPSGRSGHAMAYDDRRGITVLFGGNTGDAFSPIYDGETWEWDGTRWTQRLVSGPTARFSAVMGFDSSRGVSVMYGGRSRSILANNDTWEWDGTTWVQRAVGLARGRGWASMAFDSTHEEMVLFGGYSGGASLGDTWTLGARCLPFSIRVDPVRETVCGQDRLSLSLQISPLSTATRTYQWRRGDPPEPILGAWRATYDDAIVHGVGAGRYDCLVTFSCGTFVSAPAYITVCVADTDDGTSAGRCDGGVTIDDLFFFVDQYTRETRRADLDDGSATGTPDGGVTIDDLLYYLNRFEAGC